MLRQLVLRNFKAFEAFSMTLADDAFIVGPNNAGKSTLIAAIRLGTSLLRYAGVRTPSRQIVDGKSHFVGYPLTIDQAVFVEENLRHEFRDEETRLELRFSNGAALKAVWPISGESSPEEGRGESQAPFFYLTVRDRPQPKSTKAVRDAFPKVGVIPMLTPLEHDESVLDEKYVRRNLDGRLTSRHFRNQLHLLKNEYSPSHSSRLAEFFEFAKDWMPELEVEALETSLASDGYQLDLYYREPGLRANKEIYWAGDGIQVWFQLLLHVFRLGDVHTVVIDEPDVFLHADLQRRLVRLLEGLSAQTVTATHSPEMLAEASAETVVWVDKTKRRAVRGPHAGALSEITEALGSQFNLRLAKALRSRVVLFVEGADMKLLRHVAMVVGAKRLAAETNIAIVPLEGFSNWEHVEPFAWLVRHLLKDSVRTFVILDRDYRSDTAVTTVVARLADLGIECHVWGRKELESYLLVPRTIARVTKADAAWVQNALGDAAASLGAEVFARALDESLREEVSADKHRVTITEAFQRRFDGQWSDKSNRLRLCSPKKVIRFLNKRLADEKLGQISARALAKAMRAPEVPAEMRDVLLEIESAIE